MNNLKYDVKCVEYCNNLNYTTHTFPLPIIQNLKSLNNIFFTIMNKKISFENFINWYYDLDVYE